MRVCLFVCVVFIAKLSRAESVRKYPTLPMLNRICTADYFVPAANYTIREGTPVVISIMGFSRDEKYFPQPERFWPERFEPATGAYDANAFIPFGEGPRQCIGEWNCTFMRSWSAHFLCKPA